MKRREGSKRGELEIDRNTLHVYWFVLENSQDGVGARRVQRALRFKSPSSAIYHLEKLRDIQLLRKERSGIYIPLTRRKFGMMRYFVFVRNRFVPKHLFYAVIVSVTITLTWILTWSLWSIGFFLSFLPAILAAIILWVQTFEFYRAKPRFHEE